MRQIIHNVRIFDGSGADLRAGAILIDGATIAEISYEDGAFADVDADNIIDGNGATLMPGMVEAHGHMTWGSSIEKIYHQFMLPPEELRIAAYRNARVLLESGFTSVYSAGALGDSIETDLACDIAAGNTAGPRFIPSTLERSPEGDDTGDIFNGRGADAMLGFTRYCKEQGVKIVKLVISGEDALKPGSSKDILYTEEELAAASKGAQENDLWISAHAYWPEAIQLALKTGARMLYHCSFADAASIDAMVAAKDKIFYAPGPGVSVAAIEASPPPHIDMSSMKASAVERLALEAVLVPELKRRGVRILIGGDYGFPFNPNGTNARDLQHFVTHYGYTPAEALHAATMLGGELMDMPVGQIKQGYLADLLMIDGDPTADVSIMMDRSKFKMIMKGGEIIPSAQAKAA